MLLQVHENKCMKIEGDCLSSELRHGIEFETSTTTAARTHFMFIKPQFQVRRVSSVTTRQTKVRQTCKK